ncbi:hypothetical protein ASC96_27435 [Rhizobium sp. Root1204]|nr:hypothetical protein ASC96_27435 [Rhizobium sp. Root1204]
MGNFTSAAPCSYGPHLADCLCVIADDIAADRQGGAIEEICAEIARLDDRDVNAKRCQFVMQSFAQAPDGKLSRGIDTEPRGATLLVAAFRN